MYDDLYGKEPEIVQSRPTTPEHIRRSIRKLEEKHQAIRERNEALNYRYRKLREHQLSFYQVLMNEESCKCNFCKSLVGLSKSESMREILKESQSRNSKIEHDEDTISVNREMMKVSDVVDYFKVRDRILSKKVDKEVIVLSEIDGKETKKNIIVSEHHDRIPIKTEKFIEKKTRDGKVRSIHVSDHISYIPCKTETRKVYYHYTKGCLIDRGFMGIFYYIEWSESFRKDAVRHGPDLFLQHRWPLSNKYSEELPEFLKSLSCII